MLIDGHVHLYPGVDRGAFLSAAAHNLATAGRRAGLNTEPFALLLTETPRETGFDDLTAGRDVPLGWRVELLPDDPLAIRLHGPDTQALVLVAGRQIVSAERLEVLAIGYRGAALDGQPLDDVLRTLRAEGRPAILPWGAGKWLGARGARIAALVSDGLPTGVFLGDNGGRPLGWPAPGVFAAAGLVLPGSDPLPVFGAWRDVGRYGFHLSDAIDPARPARSILSALLALRHQPTIIGRRVALPGFVARQIRLRVS
ncbi:hypothetical protein [Oceaniovalibus sp. ACAM 378]|uniref:hypothetical protein n=1 Tax=Oceaniovalibus sp. ACAM 378 TaxID=2599923 RepID=UPI0011D7330A|nr:hypothetical protein [Oceaniovalibus sp. ACAM 378]TYB89489.1 hypothetical protein FQ320_08380 [Oceaniovalibus sp. ACAM 378]